MATVIDQKIVQLKFDNSNFEQNTRQSMSTLDKLKEKLHFKGASEGLENVEKAARKVNMNGLANGVEEVKVKFSALEVIGVTALANITNSAVNMGKQLLASITIDPLKAGWNKMDQMMGNVQTLVNATGKSVDEIEGYLEDLMWYSDETSYGFTDMTAALASMASSGGDIDKLIPTIIGIANATAFAGKGAAEFSRVIYNLNQSYGTGYLQNRDWMSVEMAGASSKQLKATLIETAEEMGKIKKGAVTIGNFRETLKDKWADTEVMEAAFGKFASLTMAVKKAEAEAEENGGFYTFIDATGKEQTKLYTTAAKAIRDMGLSCGELGYKAFKAAQEAKTFTEAIEATKDATSSAWMNIYKTIFGNFDSQVEIWTNLANYLYDIFVEPLNNLQAKLRETFGFDKSVGALFDKIENGIKSIEDKVNNNPLAKGLDKITEKTQQASKSLDYYQKIVWNVWEGNYKNAPKRYDLLRKAGYDPRVVQELVNIGDRNGKKQKYKITLEDVIKAEKKYGYTVTETEKALDEETKATFGQAKALDELTDEQLESIGLSEDEIDMYNRLRDASKKYGLSLDKLVDKLKKNNARDLLFGAPELQDVYVDKETNEVIDPADRNGLYFEKDNTKTVGAFVALLRTFRNVLIMVKQAWASVFSFDSVDLYMAIDRFKEFANAIYNVTKDEDKMENLRDTFRGLFSILKLITTLINIPVKIAWTIFKTVLQTFGVTLLDVTGTIGNILAEVVNWITNNNLLIDGIKWLTETISRVIVKIYTWIQEHVKLNQLFKSLFGSLGNLKKRIVDFFKNFWEGAKKAKAEGKLGEYLVQSFVGAINKLKDKLKAKGGIIIEWISSTFGQLGGKIGEWFKGLDPAKKAGQLGKYIIEGLWNGLKNGGSKLFNGAKWIFDVVINTIKGLFGIQSPSKVMMAIGGFIVSGLLIGIKDNQGNVLEGIKSFGGGILDTIKGFANYILSLFGTTGEKLIEIIKSIDLGSIIVAAISAGGIFAIIKMAKALTYLGESWKGFNAVMDAAAGVMNAAKAKIYTMAMKDIAISIAILAASILLLTQLDVGKMWIAIGGIVVLIGALAGLTYLAGQIGKDQKLFDLGKVGLMLLSLGVSLLLVSIAVKKLASIDNIGLAGASAMLATIVTFLGALAIMSRAKVDLSTISKTILFVGVMFYLMGKTLKMVGKLKWQDALQGTLVLTAFSGMIVGLIAATQLIGRKRKSIESIGNTLLKIGVTFYLMAMTVKKLGRMSTGEVLQGTAIIAAFGGMIFAFFKYLGNKSTSKLASIGSIMLGIGGAFVAMAIAVKILGKMDLGAVIQGTAIIGGFFALIWLFIKGLDGLDTRKVKNASGILFGIGVAMVGIALSLALLSLIKWHKLIAPVIALCVVIKVLSRLIKEVGNLKASNFKSIIAITVMVGVIAAALGILTLTDPVKLLTVAVALSGVMLALSVLVNQMNKIKPINKKNLSGLWNILIVVGILGAVAGVVYWLSTMNTDAAIKGAVAVTLLMLACAGMMYAMNAIGKINLKDVGLGLLGLAGVLAECLLAIAVLKQMEGIQNADKNALTLVTFMLGMAAVLGIVAIVGAIYAGTSGLAMLGLIGLVAVIGMLFLVIEAVKSLNQVQNAQTNFAVLMSFMTVLTDLLLKISIMAPLAILGVTALAVLSALMVAIGGFVVIVGALVTYIPQLAEFVANGLPVMIMLAGGIGEMIGAFVNGILTQVMEGLPGIGLQLSKFMINLTPFLAGIRLVNGNTLKGVGILTASILLLSAAELIQGIVDFLMGGDGLADMGTQLSRFATTAMPFILVAQTLNATMMSGVKSLSEAILILTAANLLQGITRFITGGGMDLATFGASLPPLGAYLRQFVDALGEFSDGQVATTDCAGKAIKALADAASEMPASGGLWQKIFGEKQSLSEFAGNMPGVAKGIKGFITNLGSFGEQQIKTAECGATVIKKLAEAAGSMQSDGGFFGKLFGKKKSLAEFAGNMPGVATNIKGFIQNLGEFKDDKLKVVDVAMKVIKSLTDLSKEDLDDFEDELPGFGDAMIKFGTKLKTFISKLAEINDEDTERASNNMNAVKVVVGAMMDTFKNTSKEKGIDLPPTLQNIAITAAKALCNDSVTKELKTQGENFVNGFIKGIDNTKQSLYNKATELGNKAKDKLKQAIDAHSPSKETQKVGNYFGEGFVLGIEEYATRVYDVSSEVGIKAREGLSNAVSTISSLIDSDMDTQPTIRPVLDLSEVSAGANSIGSMFSDPSVGVLSNIKTISSQMNSRIQNGGNSDVVSAIGKLGNSLKNRGDTYNINGITYDDSSNVNSAVKELIRAIEVERRV